MDCNFYVGQALICLSEMTPERIAFQRELFPNWQYPRLSEKYHVRSLTTCPRSGRVCLYLVEVVNSVYPNHPLVNPQIVGFEPAWTHTDFRPLTSIEDLRRITASSPVTGPEIERKKFRQKRVHA